MISDMILTLLSLSNIDGLNDANAFYRPTTAMSTTPAPDAS
jgi:hypothetical protein